MNLKSTVEKLKIHHQQIKHADRRLCSSPSGHKAHLESLDVTINKAARDGASGYPALRSPVTMNRAAVSVEYRWVILSPHSQKSHFLTADY